MLKQTLTDEAHQFATAPQDYELYQLGEYDDNSGKFDTYAPAHILNLVELSTTEE